MSSPLHIHPSAHSDAVRRIDADASRSATGEIKLRYSLTGEIAKIALPLATKPKRADGLWRHTCFEAFLRREAGDTYFEFNFSPSTEWAAYRFTGHREGMAPLDVSSPKIDAKASSDMLALDVVLALDRVKELDAATWRLGLAAVIEEANGRLSHWALAHPPGKPDFHHRDCFQLRLPAASSL